VLTFAITWGAQLPAVLAHYGLVRGPAERFLPLVGLGMFGPVIAATILSRRAAGGAGAGSLFGQLLVFRAAPIWYAVALALPGGILTAGLVIAHAFGATGRLFYPPIEPPRIAALVLVPFVEEIGWRGFAYPRLRDRHGPLAASLTLGALWGLWHTEMFLLQGLTAPMFLITIPYFLAGSVLFAWLYDRPGGGLPLAVLAHAGAHLDNSHLALPGDVTPLAAQTIGFCVLAAALVVSNPSAWRIRPPALRAI